MGSGLSALTKQKSLNKKTYFPPYFPIPETAAGQVFFSFYLSPSQKGNVYL